MCRCMLPLAGASSSDFCKEHKDFMGRKKKVPDIRNSSRNVKVSNGTDIRDSSWDVKVC